MQTSSSNCLTVRCWKIIFLNNTAHIKENRIYRGCSMIGNSNNTASSYLIKAWDSSRMKMQWIDGKRLLNLKSATIPHVIGNEYYESICLEMTIKIKKWKNIEKWKLNKTSKIVKIVKTNFNPCVGLICWLIHLHNNRAEKRKQDTDKGVVHDWQ